jgi:hypothetical protein
VLDGVGRNFRQIIEALMSPGCIPAEPQWRWKNGISQPRFMVCRKRRFCSARNSSREARKTPLKKSGGGG